MVSRLQLRVIKKEKVAQNAWVFTLERPDNFTFSAGQYIRIYDPRVGEAVFRDFTIASSPFQKEYLLLIIKEGISEYKKHLLSIDEGKSLLVEAPLGRFSIDERETLPLVMIAGGVGITPFYSMIQFAQHKNLLIPITLIASFSKVENVLFYNELQKMKNLSNNLQVAYTITKPQVSLANWASHTGRISEKLIKVYIKDVTKQMFLISGSPSFVIDMENLLRSMKVASSQIRVEVFLGFS